VPASAGKKRATVAVSTTGALCFLGFAASANAGSRISGERTTNGPSTTPNISKLAGSLYGVPEFLQDLLNMIQYP